MHWDINPTSKTPPPFLPSPLKLANCSSPPFLGNPPPPLYCFSWHPPFIEKSHPLFPLIVFLFLNQNFWKIYSTPCQSVFHIHNPKGTKLITQLHLGLSHLCKCKNLNTALKICPTPFACLAVLKLNPVLITYSTVPSFWRRKLSSWMLSVRSTLIY